ncbi:hypothetical protein GCM10009037_17280 [Halarchaeum grantii]|uniref:Type IV secretion system protein TrbL n=1 Tax=Halarchaeum grantii TaxID=1193105 RepID=A0A830EXG6_9EURY|nr:hypothetical protein [Halarchaeum grantii]GGL34222.1 hypothetical protein GCM10009037_17280 [Halarchaeum grantii]
MSALGDAIVEAIERFLQALFEPVTNLIQTHGNDLLAVVVGTPAPDRVFAPPTTQAWPAIYDYYWHDVVPIALLLWGLSVGLVIFLESTNYLFSSYHGAQLKRRAFAGLMGILAWWWLAALSLQFTNALTGAFVPDLSEISLFQTLSFSALGLLGLLISLSIDLVFFLLIGAIYFIRQLTLYLFVLMMPILIALWVPGVGPFAYVSRFVQRLAGFYVPFLLMPLPVAILLRLGGLLGESATFDADGVFLWLTALVIPIVAVLSPFVFVWQAGSLLFVGDRISHRVSRTRAQSRLSSNAARMGNAHNSGRNFVRGVRGSPPVRRDGQTLLASSRSHAAGARVARQRRALDRRRTSRTRSRSSRSRRGDHRDDDASTDDHSRNH